MTDTAVFYDQEFLVEDDSGRTGDCMRAAVATLLQLAPQCVPHFAEFADWIAAVRAFRDELQFRWPSPCGHPGGHLFPAEGAAGDWVIGCGRSPRGHMHAVILSAEDGTLVHDPHPSRAGLVGQTEYILVRADRQRG